MDELAIVSRLAVTQAMVDELTDYLMGHELYRQLYVPKAPGNEQPVMTLGALLENVAFLRREEANLTGAQRAVLDEVERKLAEAHRVFGAQWKAMLRREFKALTNSWRWYLEEAEERPSARDRYPSEVHLRTRLDLLARELASDPDSAREHQHLQSLDARLSNMLEGSTYVGPPGAEDHYSPDRNWWLYGRPLGSGQRE